MCESLSVSSKGRGKAEEACDVKLVNLYMDICMFT